MQVPHHAAQPLSIAVVGQDHTRVLHKLSCRRSKHISKGLKSPALLPIVTTAPLPSPSSVPSCPPFPHRPVETHHFTPHRAQPSHPRLQGGTYVAGLASWGTAHIQDAFVLLRSQSHDGEETGGSLQHVVPSQILRGGTWAGKAEQTTRERKDTKSRSAQPHARKGDLTNRHRGVINNKSCF